MTLSEVLQEAIKYVSEDNTDEERGGVVLVNKDDYQFISLRNMNTTMPLARVLWVADKNEYAKKVIPLFRNGWKQHGSFHSHPSFSPEPSSIDINTLFPGFTTNYIYSCRDKLLASYCWKNQQVVGNLIKLPTNVEI